MNIIKGRSYNLLPVEIHGWHSSVGRCGCLSSGGEVGGAYIHVIIINTTYFLLSVRLSSSFSLGEFSRMSPPAYDWCYEQPGGLELSKYCYNQK